ncbi:hypothetical protein EVAR_26571_1 [Eumeta japonica]|uniref:Uncharacterized protein n=1 Tax=Eumeta variegata TaxID=151549 RepID=A0A4C1W3M2_EUMVA|nr:hypothetical protein EVAR_26571_1 [Eumeta japonica]
MFPRRTSVARTRSRGPYPIIPAAARAYKLLVGCDGAAVRGHVGRWLTADLSRAIRLARRDNRSLNFIRSGLQALRPGVHGPRPPPLFPPSA